MEHLIASCYLAAPFWQMGHAFNTLIDALDDIDVPDHLAKQYQPAPKASRIKP